MDNTPKLENTENQLEIVGHVSQSSFEDYYGKGWVSYGVSSERLGGLARAASAFRDNFGRFLHKYGFVHSDDLDKRILGLFLC